MNYKVREEESSILFRFYAYSYLDDGDKYRNSEFITGVRMRENAGVFLSCLKQMLNRRFFLNEEWYIADEIVFSYIGDEEHVPTINIYCYKEF